MPNVKKHVLDKRSDERGWVVNPLVPPPTADPLGHAHLASLEPRAVRGNHVHPASSEYVLVWGGRAEVAWEGDGRIVTEEAGEDELVVFEIPAGVAHAVTNTGDTTVFLMAYYYGRSEEEWPATERKPIA